MATFALHPEDFEGTAEQDAAAGVRLGEIRPLSRPTPDGELLQWRLTSPGHTRGLRSTRRLAARGKYLRGAGILAGVRSSWQTRLLQPTYIGYAGCDIQYHWEPPPEDLIARLHLVARTPTAEVLVCRSVEEWRFLPGGTREPGEPVAELAARELLEEAGAELRGPVRLFGAHEAISRLDHPYRPHLPHPRAYWAYAVADVVQVGPPTNPDDGEQVVAVSALPPAEAVTELASHDALHADVLSEAIRRGLV